METVEQVVESGINPIVFSFDEVKFFEKKSKILRSFITINSLELGVLTYKQYRFVARRTRVGNRLVKRHFEKLFRLIPEILSKDSDIDAFTVPVYARLLADSELAAMLVDMLSLYPEVPAGKICIELSADILYENLKEASEKINELRELGVKIAICEVGDEFCPVFRLSEVKFDYAFMDSYSTDSLDGDSAERIAGSLVKYLHYLDAKVIAPGLDSNEKIDGAKRVGVDGYTEDVNESTYIECGGADE